MPFTLEDLANVNEAIASGAKQVTIGSQSVSYRNMEELKDAKQQILADLAVQGDAPVSLRMGRLYMGGRGYNGCGDR